ncbi:MAG: response regulator transcription factor [Roseibium sp.]|uniref:response regulator n=1 Tax=Roseibium sp. TaxID=1936156 RepID=UPI00262E435B|nr:response regulator transcription factor [Roseibium sp.]MCV0425072.1 response regulator transcription factor [Roseibium sp.]
MSLNSIEERKRRIAIVDDDPEFRQSLCDLLYQNGFETVSLASGEEFFALGPEIDLDLVLLDLRLDGESGLSLAMAIRETMDLPIMMLTGVGDEIDKIVGLETGADDYLMKPFNPRELIARIKAILRRTGSPPVYISNSSVPDTGTIEFGDKVLDTSKRALSNAAGEEILLTNAEYRLLAYLLRHPDEIIPRRQLLEELGGNLSQYVDRTIDVLILRLRRKIEKVPSKPVHLQTRRGMGYIFVLNAKVSTSD